jgi:hypothetical protein
MTNPNISLNDAAHPPSEPLPAELKPLFWDHVFEQIDFGQHRDFVIGRILSVGDWNSVQWLRSRVGKEGVRSWIVRREGRGLTPPQLRFWELVLPLPADQVNSWLAAQKELPWNSRISR